MGEELGLAKWLEMSSEEQSSYLDRVAKLHAKKLRQMRYEDSFQLTHQLLSLVPLFPSREHRGPKSGIKIAIERAV